MIQVSLDCCDAAKAARRSEGTHQPQWASVLQGLHSMAYLRDSDTALHTMRMAHYAAALAAMYGVGARLQELILLAAPLHDIGKLGTPDSILLKQGPLTEEEWAVMRQHTIVGHDMLREHQGAVFEMGAEIALSHHERWDGSGYPYRLAGTSIPLSARIVAVADVFDALTSARPYKSAWSCEEAVNYIGRNAGCLFDPDIVRALYDSMGTILRIKARFREEPAAGHPTAWEARRLNAHPSTVATLSCPVC